MGVCHRRQMASPPRRPSKRQTDVSHDAVADRAFVARRTDPLQAALFDQSPRKWIKPFLPTLVDKPPVGPQMGALPQHDGVRGGAARRLQKPRGGMIGGINTDRLEGITFSQPSTTEKLGFQRRCRLELSVG